MCLSNTKLDDPIERNHPFLPSISVYFTLWLVEEPSNEWISDEFLLRRLRLPTFAISEVKRSLFSNLITNIPLVRTSPLNNLILLKDMENDLILSSNSDDKPYSCDQCNRRFKERRETLHTIIKGFTQVFECGLPHDNEMFFSRMWFLSIAEKLCSCDIYAVWTAQIISIALNLNNLLRFLSYVSEGKAAFRQRVSYVVSSTYTQRSFALRLFNVR